MSRRPIAHSPDLLRLQNEGYNLELRANGALLLIRDVPYVTSKREVCRDGVLVLKLRLAGDVTEKPTDHTARWMGEHPCHADGRKIAAIENGSAAEDLGDGVKIDFVFSAKADYRDYYHQAMTYIGCIAGEAATLEPDADARTFPVIPEPEDASVFKYADTASTRAGIQSINEKVSKQKIGIIGGGGTGSYILDFTAKTMVAEIHVFDGDLQLNHNAFRSPGAASIDTLQKRPKKVDYLGDIYDHMRRGIVRHPDYLDDTNLHLLDGLDFVFLCIDRGAIKRRIVERLVRDGTAFIDVGMGILDVDGRLAGTLRTTLSTPENREAAAPHISYAEDDGVRNEYTTNIQIAELNAHNAAQAVIRWKQYFGLCQDLRQAASIAYSIGSGAIRNS